MTEVEILGKDKGDLPSKITLMPGVKHSPETVLHKVLEESVVIRNVTVCVQYDDGSHEFYHSRQNAADLMLAAALLYDKALSIAKKK